MCRGSQSRIGRGEIPAPIFEPGPVAAVESGSVPRVQSLAGLQRGSLASCIIPFIRRLSNFTKSLPEQVGYGDYNTRFLRYFLATEIIQVAEAERWLSDTYSS